LREGWIAFLYYTRPDGKKQDSFLNFDKYFGGRSAEGGEMDENQKSHFFFFFFFFFG